MPQLGAAGTTGLMGEWWVWEICSALAATLGMRSTVHSTVGSTYCGYRRWTVVRLRRRVVCVTYATAGTVPLAANACLQQLAMLAFVLLDGTDGRHNIQRLTVCFDRNLLRIA